MKRIDSQADFDAALQAENAVVLTFFDWSEQSERARQAVQEWEQELASQAARPNFDIHLLAPDERPYTWKWMNEHAAQAGDSGGSGTLLWLRRGTVAGGVPDAAEAGIKTLNRMTNECFVQGKSPGFSPLPMEHPAFDVELLGILCCPETRQKFQLAAPPVLEKLNRQMATGALRNRAGRALDEKITGGLVRADGKYLYPMRQNIPVLLVDEAIPLMT